MKRKQREPIVNYDASTDVLYLVTHEGVETEFEEIIPGVNGKWMSKGRSSEWKF